MAVLAREGQEEASALQSPAAGNVTCIGGGGSQGKKYSPSKLLVSPCFGRSAKHSSRVSHRDAPAGTPPPPLLEVEFAAKSHRLLHRHHIRKKLSTSRVAALSKGKSAKEHTERETLREEVDHEIRELERDLLQELSASIVREMAALEAAGHGSCGFLGQDLGHIRDEFMSQHTLRRFLIARQWDVDQATSMIMEYYRWREANPVGCIQHSTIQASLAAKKVYMLKERDWEGRPVLVVVATRHMVENQPLEETIRFVQYCTDKIMHIAMDDDRGVSKMCVFVDLRNVGDHCLDKTALGNMLDLMQNYFPERLGTAILWRPPWIFWLAWKLIHNFIPKETRRRMCFAYKQKDVGKFMDPAFVPQSFGGGGTADDDILVPIEEA